MDTKRWTHLTRLDCGHCYRNLMLAAARKCILSTVGHCWPLSKAIQYLCPNFFNNCYILSLCCLVIFFFFPWVIQCCFWAKIENRMNWLIYNELIPPSSEEVWEWFLWLNPISPTPITCPFLCSHEKLWYNIPLWNELPLQEAVSHQLLPICIYKNIHNVKMPTYSVFTQYLTWSKLQPYQKTNKEPPWRC